MRTLPEILEEMITLACDDEEVSLSTNKGIVKIGSGAVVIIVQDTSGAIRLYGPFINCGRARAWCNKKINKRKYSSGNYLIQPIYKPK